MGGGGEERGGEETGYTKHGAPTHENQMKGRLDDSGGLGEEDRERKGAHKAVRVSLPLSIITRHGPDALLCQGPCIL